MHELLKEKIASETAFERRKGCTVSVCVCVCVLRIVSMDKNLKQSETRMTQDFALYKYFR